MKTLKWYDHLESQSKACSFYQSPEKLRATFLESPPFLLSPKEVMVQNRGINFGFPIRFSHRLKENPTFPYNCQGHYV